MSTGAIVAIIIAAVVVLALAAFLARLELRRRHLRNRFGHEYDRIREDSGGRRAADQQLTDRERRHAELGVKPISPMSRDRYTQSWALIQATFVDQPTKAVDEADRLVVTIMEERGYPYAGFDERLAMLSVEHGAVLQHYRDGHDIRARHAVSQLSTEDLRTAMVHYRTLVEDLLDAREPTIKPKLMPSKPLPTKASVDGGGEQHTEARHREVIEDDRDREVIEDAEPRRELATGPAADASMRPEAESRMHPEAETRRV